MKTRVPVPKKLIQSIASKKVYLGCARNFFIYSFRYPWGLLRAGVVKGYFPHPSKGRAQESLFKALLDAGFKRTCWQLILPGQTAGIVRRVPRGIAKSNQYHIRFYADGTIDCEIEYHRFHIRHWSNCRTKGTEMLQQLLEELSDLPSGVKAEIQELFNEDPVYS